MTVGMEAGMERVTSWLKNFFGDVPILQYEVNAQTIDILHELAENNEACERDTELLIDGMNHMAASYQEEAKYLEALLTKHLGFSITSLSEEGTNYLNELVNTALTLEIKDTSLASFVTAINDMTWELCETESENRELEWELTTIKNKLTAALVLEKRLQEDLKKTEEDLEVEEAQTKSRSQNLNFLQNKSDDFKTRIKTAEEQLAAAGLDQSLMHQSLLDLSEELSALEKEVKSLKKKLEPYYDLAPNPSLAKVKIEEAKQELGFMDCECPKCPARSMRLDGNITATAQDALKAEVAAHVDKLGLSMPESSKF